jgi:hypothetical protein
LPKNEVESYLILFAKESNILFTFLQVMGLFSRSQPFPPIIGGIFSVTYPCPARGRDSAFSACGGTAAFLHRKVMKRTAASRQSLQKSAITLVLLGMLCKRFAAPSSKLKERIKLIKVTYRKITYGVPNRI